MLWIDFKRRLTIFATRNDLKELVLWIDFKRRLTILVNLLPDINQVVDWFQKEINDISWTISDGTNSVVDWFQKEINDITY